MGKGWGKIFEVIGEFQRNLESIKRELEEKRVSATAGGGVVTAEVNGKQELVSLKIDPEVLDSKDVEMLEGLIIAAVNEALRRSKELIKEEMTKLAGGLPLPDIF